MVLTRRGLGICLLGSLALGCGGTPGPTTYPVTGTVTLDGEPVEGAAISLRPVGAGQGGQGVSQADGTFSLQTPFDAGRRYQDGMLPGDYAITVRKLDYQSGKRRFGPLPDLLPQKYAGFKTSGLSATVAADADNSLPLQLTTP